MMPFRPEYRRRRWLVAVGHTNLRTLAQSVSAAGMALIGMLSHVHLDLMSALLRRGLPSEALLSPRKPIGVLGSTWCRRLLRKGLRLHDCLPSPIGIANIVHCSP